MRVKEWKAVWFFARGGGRRSQKVMGCACCRTRRGARTGGAPFRATACFNGETCGPLGAGAPLGALPLFAGTTRADPPPAPEEIDPLQAALAELDPDRLSPREALEALYRLKALLAVSAAART